ncbi:GATA transcription factor 18 [Apostasia shenzhenica]|uniref:GATA transcription factor 18 n=1 Tax=Apostasia shenzhenica TaxID=1088818 RepID=A0A2I0B2K4_9ASPA|nr:GATA transcription factor 18 [Apostasia shenzhenica]
MLRWCGNGSAAAAAGGVPASPCSFSMLFPVPGVPAEETIAEAAASSSVDCTLSLGTPYTRHQSSSSPAMRRSPSVSSSLCLDILPQSSSKQMPPASSASSAGAGDPFLLARRCANCDTTSTPLWRNGPRGPKSLCNACGIRYKKEERRAAASSTTTTPPAAAAAAALVHGDGFSYGCGRGGQQHPWSYYPPPPPPPAKNPVISIYGGEQGDLPWRMNVVPAQFPAVGERSSSLFQYQ